MNCRHYLSFLLILSYPEPSTPADIHCAITSYGVTALDNKQIVVRDSHSPTDRRHLVETAKVTSVTSRIPAQIGVSFGVQYEINDIPLKDGEIIEVDRDITFPLMRKPDGSTSNTYHGTIKLAVKNGRVVAQTGYTFEYDYELVPGVWEFAIRLNGETLCKHQFVVFSQMR
jgi:hypothetical protein